MKSMMINVISSDYDRGLRMLKNLLETGEVPSSLEFGHTKIEELNVFGISASCLVKDIGKSMEESFCKFGEILELSDIKPVAPPLAIYHKWDFAKGLCDYTIGAPFSADTDAPSGFVTKTIPAGKCYTVEHTGPYQFIANAWAAGYSHMRAKQFTLNKKIDAFEIYLNDPKEVDEKELISVVHFPMK